MQNIPTKATGDSLTATEFNQIPDELENAITDVGQTLSGADVFQLSKAMSTYAAGGAFYTDSGAADAYVLSTVGSKRAPIAYFDGMAIAFDAGNNNTGASTVNVSGLGVKSIVMPDASACPADVISGITLCIFDNANDRFELRSTAAANTVDDSTFSFPATDVQTALEKLFQGIGSRNAIINGNFRINQRAVSGTVVLSAGVYGHDRWKAGAGGCTYTFATVQNITTITITAGTLQQVIDGDNLKSDTYSLSWNGTAQGKIGAGSFSASGVTGAAVGGTNLTIEFNTGTISEVQFEQGTTVTEFEQRHISHERKLCYWYFRIFDKAIFRFAPGQCISGTQADMLLRFDTMRVAPSGVVTNPTSFSVTDFQGTGIVATNVVVQSVDVDGARLRVTVAAGLSAGDASSLDTGATGTLSFSAEL